MCEPRISKFFHSNLLESLIEFEMQGLSGKKW